MTDVSRQVRNSEGFIKAKPVNIDGVTYPTRRAAIVALVKKGRSVAVIARRLEITPGAVSQALHRSRDDEGAPAVRHGRAANDRPAKRSCLGCGRTFNSTGFGNRMCRACKSGSQGIAI